MSKNTHFYNNPLLKAKGLDMTLVSHFLFEKPNNVIKDFFLLPRLNEWRTMPHTSEKAIAALAASTGSQQRCPPQCKLLTTASKECAMPTGVIDKRPGKGLY